MPWELKSASKPLVRIRALTFSRAANALFLSGFSRWILQQVKTAGAKARV
jgi:hypothetical protein